jgi:hypothetical protein
VIVDGRDFLVTAQQLIAGATEADWRSAISRGYYAVFHYFRDWLESHGVRIGKAAQAHSNLYIGLYNCGVPSVKPIAQKIDQLREERGHADYNLRRTFSQAESQSLVQDCFGVIARFQTLLATVPAATIAAGIRSYLQSIGRLPP